MGSSKVGQTAAALGGMDSSKVGQTAAALGETFFESDFGSLKQNINGGTNRFEPYLCAFRPYTFF